LLLLLEKQLFFLLTQALGFFCCNVVIKNLLIPGLNPFFAALGPQIVKRLDGLFKSEASDL
jgi:hypothetical protein